MQRCLARAAAVVFLLWLPLTLSHGEDAAASSSMAYVAAGASDGYSSLLAAFQNQEITEIVLVTNYTVGDEFEPYTDQPVPIQRNLTITGLPGTKPLLDLNRQAGVVQICSTCVLRLANISLANLTRSGSGIVTFFRGQLGARMVQQNAYSVRLVCQATDVELAVMNQTQRSSRFSSPAGGQQLASSVNATYQGRSFPGAFRAEDVSVDVALTPMGPGSFSGGFAIQWLNTTRICWSFVSDECVQRESSELCIAQQTHQLLAAMAGSSDGGSAKRAAAIAVPVAVVGALLLAALALLLRRRKRHRQQDTLLPKAAGPAFPDAGPKAPSQQQQQQQRPAAAGEQLAGDTRIEVVLAGNPAGSTTANAAAAAAGPASAGASADSRAASVQGSTRRAAAAAAAAAASSSAALDRGAAEQSGSTVFTEVRTDGNMESGSLLSANFNSGAVSFSSSQQHHSGPNQSHHSGPPSGLCASINGTTSAMVPLAVAQHGWQLTSSRTTPGLQEAADAEGSSIEWGELLGAGSFGRVYKCRWAGMDVAVKVIQHDASALQAVENEVQLQMYLNHPNIVRAFHYITHTHKPSSPTSRSAITNARAGGGLAATLMIGDSGSRKPAAVASVTETTGLISSSSSGLDTFNASSSALQRSSSRTQSQAQLLSPKTPNANLQRLQPAWFTESGTGFTGATGTLFANSSSAAGLADSNSPLSPVADSAPVRRTVTAPGKGAAAAPARCVEFEQADDGPEYSREPKRAPGNAKPVASPKAAAAAAAAPASEAGFSSSSSGGSSNSGNHVTSGGGTSSHGGHSSSEQLGAPPGWPILMLDQALSNSTGLGAAAGLHTLGTLAMRMGASGAAGSMGGSGGLRRGALERKLRFRSADISETWLVQELCDCGTLASIASNYWRRETEDEVQMLQRLLLLRDVAAGMEFLHSKNIVHSDLNANNVLVSSCEASPNGLVAKLADLGLSLVINQHRTHRTTHTFGTLSHMPPCLLREGRLTTRADVYALAMVMWQLFTGEPAWHGLHYGQFFQKVVLEHSRPPIPPDMPEDYCCLMTHCWAEEPNDRPTASVVLHCLQLMISERLKLLDHDESARSGSDADEESLAAAAAGGDEGSNGLGGGVIEAARARRRSLEGSKGKAAAAVAAAAVEQAVEAAGGSQPV